MVDILPEIIAGSVAMVACLAEWMHSRRIRRIRFLTFGPSGLPTVWSRLAPVFRTVGLAAAAWGLASLWLVVEAEIHNSDAIDEKDIRHLVLLVDVSPSMHLKDAGPDGKKGRRHRASDVLESLFNRIPMQQFRITVIGFYSDAKMLLEDSSDHEVVRHILETMPLWHAYKPGKTKIISGIKVAANAAKKWPIDSTYVLMLTDGDSVPPTGMPTMPSSVKDIFVVGVGDPTSGTFIDGHLSRQDTSSLRQVANRLRGVYHNGNTKHLPTKLVGRLVETNDKKRAKPWTRREWSLLAVLAGSSIFAITPILLHYFGTGFQGGVDQRTI